MDFRMLPLIPATRPVPEPHFLWEITPLYRSTGRQITLFRLTAFLVLFRSDFSNKLLRHIQCYLLEENDLFQKIQFSSTCFLYTLES